MELVKDESKEYQGVGAQPRLETTNGVSQDGAAQAWPLMSSWGDDPHGPADREASQPRRKCWEEVEGSRPWRPL